MTYVIILYARWAYQSAEQFKLYNEYCYKGNIGSWWITNKRANEMQVPVL